MPDRLTPKDKSFQQTVRRIAARDGWRFNGMEWVQVKAA